MVDFSKFLSEDCSNCMAFNLKVDLKMIVACAS